MKQYPILPRREVKHLTEMHFRGAQAQAPVAAGTGRRSGKVGRWLVLIFLAGALTLVVSGMTEEGRLYPLLHGGGFFKVRDIVVVGSEAFSKPEVLRLAGAGTGGNLWAFPSGDVAAKLRACSRFKNVFVLKVPPQWVLVLVRERTPLALLSAGAVCGVDATGAVFPLGRKERGAALPLITGWQAGANLSRAVTLLVRDVLDSAPGLAREISEINVADPKNPVIYGNNGMRIVLGDGDYERKMRSLRAVWARVLQQGKKVKSVDLRWEGQVVVKTSS